MKKPTTQLMTFYVGRDLYGIEVMRVQEVTGELPVIAVPLAPKFVRGLINLRGQIATALGMKELFNITVASGDEALSEASVVCKLDGNLISLIVNAIGDVVEVSETQFELPPDIVPFGVRKFLKGIYKTESALLSVIDLEKLSKELSYTSELNEPKAV